MRWISTDTPRGATLCNYEIQRLSGDLLLITRVKKFQSSGFTLLKRRSRLVSNIQKSPRPLRGESSLLAAKSQIKIPNQAKQNKIPDRPPLLTLHNRPIGIVIDE